MWVHNWVRYRAQLGHTKVGTVLQELKKAIK